MGFIRAGQPSNTQEPPRHFPTSVTSAGCLRDPRRLDVVAQDELVAQLRRGPLSGELKPWLDHHALRYGW